MSERIFTYLKPARHVGPMLAHPSEATVEWALSAGDVGKPYEIPAGFAVTVAFHRNGNARLMGSQDGEDFTIAIADTAGAPIGSASGAVHVAKPPRFIRPEADGDVVCELTVREPAR